MKKTEKQKTEKIKTEAEIRYDNYYHNHNVCPYCNHTKIVEIYTGSDGFFSSKRFSHYKCSNCSREFDTKGYLSLCPSDEVKRIVQLGLDKKIGRKEMRDLFSKIGVYIRIW